MTLTPEKARAMASRAVEFAVAAGAEGAEAVVMATEAALTRFARNRIHQNVVTDDAGVSVRAVLGRRVGVSSTNRTDDASLRDCCAAALDAARRAPEDPQFPGLPAPRPVSTPVRTAEATRAFGPSQRAEAVAAIVSRSESRGLSAAGQVSVSDDTLAVANSLGVDVAMPTTSYRATVVSMGPDGGSGWSSAAGRDTASLLAEELGDRAATLAQRSERPVGLEPGDYAVVLAPDAVADIVQFLGWYGCSAKALEEGTSFMSGHLGQPIVSPAVTLLDDALAAHALGPTFDFEGMPKTCVTLIDNGVAAGPVTDSYWAARTGRPNTGHALPAPNSFGPLPLDLALEAGSSTPDEMIASVDRGVYVTRFHYVNIEDPISATLTGMTRDGTFLIEDGRLTTPLRNLRFTQSAVEALSAVRAAGSQRHVTGGDGAAYVPHLLLERFAFTGQTG